MTYAVEPTRGIPFARNRAIEVAGSVDLIGFLDDDEEPVPTWLHEVMRVRRETAAQVVVGPSTPVFEPGTPRWVIEGGFFERRRFATGERIPSDYARTSGVLLERAALLPAPAFDTSFRLAGESDTLFFDRLARAGSAIVWSDEAVMTEHVPRSRATASWLVRRYYRIGNGRSIRMLRLDRPGFGRRAKRIVRGLLEMALGMAKAVAAVPRGRAHLVAAVQVSACGAGLVTGALGIAYQEYRVVHGR